MKKLLLLSALLCTPAMASNYSVEIDSTVVNLEHAWRGPDNHAQFNSTLYGLGLSVWHSSNFGIRASYIKGNDLNTVGKYDHITIQLKHILSFELLYKYQITDNLRVTIGIGTNLIPLPMDWEGIDPSSHAANDSDDDESYLVGLQYNINSSVSVGYRFTMYSRIKSDPYDEWTKGHSLNIAYKF